MNNIQQEWQAVIEQLKKNKNSLYDFLKDSGLNTEGDNLILYIPNEEDKKLAQSKLQNIKAQLPLNLRQKRLNIVLGSLPKESTKSLPRKTISSVKERPSSSPIISKSKTPQSPLQKLNQFVEFRVEKNHEQVQDALEVAITADATCVDLYEQLTKKTQKLANETVKVKFPWRLRVGGTRGFRELLLPVFHPIYGVPYIPSSSLKGAMRAIALQDKSNKSEVERLLGSLDNGIGCVQIFDAFPTAPCLSVDIANPQWHWQQNEVKYKSEPHFLLSMKQPEFVIGLSHTSRGKNVNQLNDLQIVKNWLEKALALGIGSRVSAGYGKTVLSASLAYSSFHDFQLWTQGIYGADTKTSEFRPVALRGMLRYWFRALALGIYSPSDAKKLEAILFGTIDPKSQEGSIRIGIEWVKAENNPPYFYKGKILLESKAEQHLTLIEKVLYLSSHIAGIGRGSRRPLHWNSGRMRGCHWELSQNKLPCNQQSWEELIKQTLDVLRLVGKSQGLFEVDRLTELHKPIVPRPIKRSQRSLPHTKSDNSPSRFQDIFNNQTHIYLVPCPNIQHPHKVQDWRKNGHTELVIGKALKLLYSSTKYKGKSHDGLGNPEVGGQLGVPSFVIIKSNYPDSGHPYQVVTVFGTKHQDRAAFINDLPAGSIKMF